MEMNNEIFEAESQMENQNTEGMEIMENNIEVTEKTVVAGFVGGLGVGLGIGLTAGTTAWFLERNKRKTVLKQLKLVVASANEMEKHRQAGTEAKTVKFGKKDKEVDITDMSLEQVSGLVSGIQREMDKVKLSKKEKAEWLEVLGDIIKIGTVAFQRQEATIKENLQQNKNAQ